jgi:protein phosphatase
MGSIDSGAATSVGRRQDNQDRAAVTPRWAAVSDGVGGHAGGARAAELTIDAVVASLGRSPDPEATVDERSLAEAVRRANEAVRAGREADPAVGGMGATLTLAGAAGPGDDRWLVAHAGDSPAWLVTSAGAERLTADHTVAAELHRAGAITSAEAAVHPGRNVITRSIGAEDEVVPDVRPVTLEPGDALVLASDGLIEGLDDGEVGRLAAEAPSAAAAAERLVAAAVEGGANDNVTVAVVRRVASSGDASRRDPH